MAENKQHSVMLINYVPGEECRVAIVEDDKLEEYHVERFSSASRVGNIYVGRVVNVEPAIQAAFVDFGVGDNGFLHVSDLHPRYFPGEDGDTTERVGLKTPRRERPPIQACLRRGDEVMVQVLKEGVGTKGPTLTSYMSIPGRFLVMMPYMDKTGVSRKVEDEEQRRNMKEILDQLELPENFGFIVRTAGMDRTKTELKRDLAYLQRLWKDMERRLKGGNKPRLLYSESDLLVRALRDLLTPEIDEIVIDHELALQRASRFLKIVSPRGSAKLYAYPGGTPIYHAYGIEQQVALIHAREVPLPSGGRLVIDQTEAVVAIDVNSGKSRESRDSETNAYQTNVEAVDEICRQLRLRDMGGIVINDLIDMRSSAHRKDIESRFKERLKRDRARSTVLPISDFGILQLTRQRMRPSHESLHFVDCPTCRGRGLLQKPESIAADGLRDLAAVIELPHVVKAEMVVAPRVAGELLSSKRHLLSRIERTSGKHVDVRVSETVQVDRVSFYAYDGQGADIDLTTVPRPKRPRDLKPFVDASDEESWAQDDDSEKQLAAQLAAEPDDVQLDKAVHPIELDAGTGSASDELDVAEEGEADQGGRRRRRRRRGRGRGREEGAEPAPRGREGGRDGGQARGPGRGPADRGPADRPRADRAPADRAPAQRPPAGSGPAGRGPADRGAAGGRRDEARPLDGRGPLPRPVTGASPNMFAGDHGDEDVAPRADASRDAHGEIDRPMNDGPGSAGLSDADAGPMDGPEGPEGAIDRGPEGGEAGDGSRRRRRRRRRGRRGRGGAGEGENRGPTEGADTEMRDAAPGAEPRGPAGADRESDVAAESPRRTAQPGDMMAGDHGDEEGMDGPGVAARSGPDGPAEAGPKGGPEGGGRRRRRRRGGRGGGGGGGAGGGEARAPEERRDGAGGQEPRSGPRSEPRPDQRAGGGGGSYREPKPTTGGPARAGSADRANDRAPDRPADPKPTGAPAPGGPASDRPRTLYGGARRKLNPSELNKRPKPE